MCHLLEQVQIEKGNKSFQHLNTASSCALDKSFHIRKWALGKDEKDHVEWDALLM